MCCGPVGEFSLCRFHRAQSSVASCPGMAHRSSNLSMVLISVGVVEVQRKRSSRAKRHIIYINDVEGLDCPPWLRIW